MSVLLRGAILSSLAKLTFYCSFNRARGQITVLWGFPFPILHSDGHYHTLLGLSLGRVM